MANRKDAMVQAAMRRIPLQGDSFSTGQIASDVGCSQSLIFRYYKTKEDLMSACFDRVCHELMLVLRSVPLPDDPSVESVNRYAIRVWEAYCGYLKSNNEAARTYLFFVGRGKRFPKGYRNVSKILKRMLDDDYERIKAVYPEFDFIAEYLIMFSYAAATGLFIEHDFEMDGAMNKLERMLKYGICGYGGSDP